jgi:hypothetical protein
VIAGARVSGAATPRAALPAAARRCANCRHFRDTAAEIEAALPGLRTLSSAHAAVRADDGLCRLHDRYLSARSRCAAHAWIGRGEEL